MTKGKIDKINAWPPGTWLDLSHGMKSQTRNAANGVTFGAVVRPQETELSQIFETRVLGIEAGLTPPPPPPPHLHGRVTRPWGLSGATAALHCWSTSCALFANGAT